MNRTTTATQARRRALLTDTAVKNLKPLSKLLKVPDSGGLVLLVQPTGAKLWRYRFWLHEKEGMFALGKYPDVTLAEARERCAAARKLVANGINPVHEQQRLKSEAAMSQRRVAEGSFEAVCQSWREVTDPELRPASLKQRDREVKNDLLPPLRDRAVDSIARLELSALLERVKKRDAPETARNLRTHLNAIFEHAIAKGLITANPTPPRSILGKRKQKHHVRLPAERMGDFLRALDGATKINPETRIAMLLTMLTACRKDEIISARWEEVDWGGEQILIPASRMKGGLPHIVVLSRQALGLLRELRAMVPAGREHLFPNRLDPSRPMANRSLNALLDRLGFGDIATVHGFRSMFSTHMNGQKEHADAIEMVLAHKPPGIRGTYNKADHLQERRGILQRWADHLDAERAKKKSEPETEHPAEVEVP